MCSTGHIFFILLELMEVIQMGGKLYTSYFSNLNNIQKSFRIFSVVRKPQDLPNIACFSPSAVLLNQYKSKKIEYPEFRRRFLKELESNQAASETFKSVINLIESGTDVVFVCYENKSTYCHRKILGELFQEAGITYCGEV